jgi:hypothetical protein
MEGRTNLQAMTSALTDLCSRALTFEAASLSAKNLPPLQQEPLPAQPDLHGLPVYPTPDSEGRTPRSSFAEGEHPHRDSFCSNRGGGAQGGSPWEAQGTGLPSLHQPHQQDGQRPQGNGVAAAAEPGAPMGAAGQRRKGTASGDVELMQLQQAEQARQAGHVGSSYSWREALDDFWRQQEHAEVRQACCVCCAWRHAALLCGADLWGGILDWSVVQLRCTVHAWGQCCRWFCIAHIAEA